MTNSDKSRRARPGPGSEQNNPNNDFVSNEIDFVAWLESDLKVLEEKFESFKTVNSIRRQLGR